MRRRRLIGIIAASVTVVAVGSVAWATLSPSGESAQAADADRSTAVIERTTLSSGLSLNAQLGYGKSNDLLGSGRAVTSLPTAGAVVQLGGAIYEADGRPAFALRGAKPLWRDLTLGDVGEDVHALRTALIELGYNTGNPESWTYDADLAAAVGSLYTDRGYPEPSLSDDAATRLKEAQAVLNPAADALAAAQAGLREKGKGPTADELASAQAAVDSAQRTLASTEAAAAQPPADNGDGTTAPAPTADDVATARDQLTIAQAALTTLNAPRDTSAESQAVASAQAAVDAATADVTKAKTNSVGPADIVMVNADSLRIDSVVALVGQSTEDVVLRWTGTSVSAYADLTPSQSRELVAGTEATVILPDKTEVAGTITEIIPSTTDAEGSATTPQAVVSLADQAPVAELGLPTVKVVVPAEEAADALVVPVTALLALAEGGYAVELVEGETTRLVAVELGLVADTRAQVISDELDAGDEVVIP